VAESNRRTLVFLSSIVAGFVVLGVVVGLVVGALVIGLVVGLLVGLAIALFAYLRSDRVALARSGAVVASIERYPRYHNLVEGLCVAAGLPKPDLYVIDTPARNAFATGRNPRHASVAVTTGLLDELNRIELEGVLACELAHVKNHDTVLRTVAVVPSMLLGRLASSIVSGPTRREQDLLADASAVQITRYPPGLCSALQKVDGNAVVRGASRATAPLWLESPLPRDGATDHASRDGGSTLEERIQILEEM